MTCSAAFFDWKANKQCLVPLKKLETDQLEALSAQCVKTFDGLKSSYLTDTYCSPSLLTQLEEIDTFNDSILKELLLRYGGPVVERDDVETQSTLLLDA